jgi:hypothetical protein
VENTLPSHQEIFVFAHFGKEVGKPESPYIREGQNPPYMTQDPQLNSSDLAENFISLLDIGVILARKKRVIVRTTLICAVIGLVMALSAPREYNSSMVVMSELGGQGTSTVGIGSALRSFGFSLPGGGAGGALTAQAIPNIVDSRQVRLSVARDTFFIPELGHEGTLVEFLSRDTGPSIGGVVGFITSWTIGLPGKILGLFRSVPDQTGAGVPGGTLFLTEEEAAAVQWVASAISTSEDIDSGLITITASGPDALLASQLVSSVAQHLRLRVQEVYTNKARQNLDFVESQFDAAMAELAAADQALAEFQDRNQSLTSSRVELEEQRLRREVTFKAQLYTELQAQMTQSRIELRKSEPVITTIETPIAPNQPSGPNRKLTMVLALILGGVVGVGLAFLFSALESGARDPEDRAKLAEISAAIPSLPRFLRRA